MTSPDPAALPAPAAPSSELAASPSTQSLGAKLFDLVIGDTEEHCQVPSEPVNFGERYWLAQHRWLEPLVGIVALLPIGFIYFLSFSVLIKPAAIAMTVVWALFLVGGLVLRVMRPCTVLRLPIHALIVWVAVVASAGLTGIAK